MESSSLVSNGFTIKAIYYHFLFRNVGRIPLWIITVLLLTHFLIILFSTVIWMNMLESFNFNMHFNRLSVFIYLWHENISKQEERNCNIITQKVACDRKENVYFLNEIYVFADSVSKHDSHVIYWEIMVSDLFCIFGRKSTMTFTPRWNMKQKCGVGYWTKILIIL